MGNLVVTEWKPYPTLTYPYNLHLEVDSLVMCVHNIFKKIDQQLINKQSKPHTVLNST